MNTLDKNKKGFSTFVPLALGIILIISSLTYIMIRQFVSIFFFILSAPSLGFPMPPSVVWVFCLECLAITAAIIFKKTTRKVFIVASIIFMVPLMFMTPVSLSNL